MRSRWKTSRHSVYSIQYHIIWCTKYRRQVIDAEVEVVLKGMIYQKCKELKIEIKALEVMSDHVHLFVSGPATLAPHVIVGQIKGFTSKTLRDKFPHIKSRMPSLWTRSYYVYSVGQVSEKNIKKYIESQKTI